MAGLKNVASKEEEERLGGTDGGGNRQGGDRVCGVIPRQSILQEGLVRRP